MKKIIAFTLAFSLMATFSCGKNKDSSSEPDGDTQQDMLTETEITIGMPTVNKLVEPSIISFNNIKKGSHIRTIDYSKLVEEDDAEHSKAMQQMQMDLITGNAPDIIVLNPSDMQTLVHKDFFADMYELMDSYGGVSREDFIPNALGGFEVNGKLPAIAPNFDLYTAVAKTEFVGADMENWKISDVVRTYEKLPDDMKLLHREPCTAQDVCNYVTYKLSDKCVDFENYTCDFSSPALTDALDFAGRFGKENADLKYSTDVTTYSGDEFQNELKNNGALISEISLTSFNQAVAWNVCYDFGCEPVTFVGYPSEDGRGSVSDCRWLYGISKDSQNKEAAWRFITYMLTDKKFQNKMNEESRGLPVIASFYDDYLALSADNDRSIFYVPDWQEDTPITKEQAEQIRDYIFRTEFFPYYSFEINSIISEECAAVINGEKTGKECADILNGRIGIYLGERK